MMQDANSSMSQQVLVMGPSGSTPVLWNPNSKDWAPLHSFGQQSSVEIALYRIQGGETGAADNYWSYLTGGTNSLPATNGAGGDSDGILLNRVSGSSSLPGQSTLSSSWFLGRSDRGSSFVSDNRRFDSVDWSAPNLAEGALTTIGVVDMLIAGAVTAGGVLGTGAGVGLYAYQTVQFRDHYQLVRCSPIGPSWCR